MPAHVISRDNEVDRARRAACCWFAQLEGAQMGTSKFFVPLIAITGCIVGDEPQPLTYDEFRAKFIRADVDAAGQQHFLYDWDQPLASEDAVRDLYAAYTRAKTGGESISEATVNLTLFGNDVWSPADRQNLSYCVSNDFGARKDAVVNALASATGAWQTASGGALRFVYRPDQDASCTNTNTAVTFNTVPSQEVNGVVASAFFPSFPREQRQVIVFVNTAFDPTLIFPLDGVLRHELGHAIGLRHETARAEAIVAFGFQCFEDVFFRPLTEFDINSVMTTPACMGDQIVNRTLSISPLDEAGVRNLYQ
jgi:hypothetical protein